MPTLSRGRKGDPGPPGPSGSGGGGGGNSSYNAINQEVIDLPAGTPVSVHSSGNGFLRASASDNSRNAVGILQSAVVAAAATDVTTDGVITLADWSAATGSVTLQPRALYYLGVTLGVLSPTPPSIAGQVNQLIGRAVGPYSLDLSMEPAILL